MRAIAAWIRAEPCAYRVTCGRRRPVPAPVFRCIYSESAANSIAVPVRCRIRILGRVRFARSIASYRVNAAIFPFPRRKGPGRRACDSPGRFAEIGAHPISSHARRSDGRSPSGLAVGGREESPGSTEARCRVTPGGGDPRESATETHRQAPSSVGRPHGTAGAVRVKWCGKSAPRRRQRRRQGKPHREQDQIGAAGGVPVSRCGALPGGPAAPPLGSVARGVRQRTSQMNGHPRRNCAAGQNPAYRPSGTLT